MGIRFVKLGGSLITDKRTAETPRIEVIERLAREVATARIARPDEGLVLGHGSGSFGHVHGRRYGTRAGVVGPAAWYGYCATADAAARLNRIIVQALLQQKIPAWSIQPSVSLRCRDGIIVDGPSETIAQALEQGLVPVVYGDVALDAVRGATIASTEEIFAWLLVHLRPHRIILVGEVDGIYTADPTQDSTARRIPTFTRSDLERQSAQLGASHGIDVTGGMQAKVAEALNWVDAHPGLDVIICSGLRPGVVEHALVGQELDAGTRIYGELDG